MSTMRERFNALVVKPYYQNTGAVFPEDAVNAYLTAINGAMPTERLREYTVDEISEIVWTAHDNIIANRGPDHYTQNTIRAWVAHELDLITCPLLPGDRAEVLITRAHNASLTAGEIVTVHSHSNNSLRVSSTDDIDWFLSRPMVRLVVSHDFPPLSTDLLAQISGTPVAERYRRLVEWADSIDFVPYFGVDDAASALAEQDRWGGVDWCDTVEGKDYLGRVLKYARERITMTGRASEPMPERILTPPEPSEIDRLTQRITTLEQEIVAERGRFSEFRTRVMQDFEIIGEELGNKADERGLCSEYDEAIRRTNNRLQSGFEIPARNEEKTFTVSGSITVPFSVEFTISVSRSEDDEEAAQNYFDNNYSASQILRNEYYDRYSAEIDEDSIEIEEQ